MFDFKGKRAVVTGAGSGIGRALALGLAQRGADLALSDIDMEGLAGTIEALAPHGVAVHQAQVDMGERAQIEAYAAQLRAECGPVHQLYNNAGIILGSVRLQEMREAHIEKILAVNLSGVIWASRAFLPDLIATGEGALINISSLNGLMGQQELSLYCASKFAVRGFTEALRCEMLIDKAPLRVVLVMPGGVATEIANRGLPSDVDLDEEARERALRRLEVYNKKLLKMPASEAAEIILRGVAKGRSRIVITPMARMLDLVTRVAPGQYPKLLAWAGPRLFGT